MEKINCEIDLDELPTKVFGFFNEEDAENLVEIIKLCGDCAFEEDVDEQEEQEEN